MSFVNDFTHSRKTNDLIDQLGKKIKGSYSPQTNMVNTATRGQLQFWESMLIKQCLC